MRIVALSDTHGYHRNLTIPDGDMLIYAGDFSMRAKLQHVTEFADWIKSLPHLHKIVVPGNHDCYWESEPDWASDEFHESGAISLVHDSCMAGGLNIFGSAYSSSIYEPSIWSFDYPRYGDKGKQLWSEIPENTDILITHGPPKGFGDKVDNVHVGEDPHVGDENLLNEVVTRIKPKIHIFGHIHEGYGAYTIHDHGVGFYNVCVCNVQYKPVNPITVIDL